LAVALVRNPVLLPAQETAGTSPDGASLEAKAKQIHERVLTIDSHVDIAGARYATEGLDPGIDHPRLRCDLVKMEQGGVDGVFLAVYVGQGKRNAEGYRQAFDAAMASFEAIHRLAEKMHPRRCKLAATPDDAERIARTGKRAIMIGIENGYPIGTDLSNVERFYNLGARYITLSHNGHNQICDSCYPRERLGDERSEHGGLSDFGRQVVAEMNRLGIMADVSHVAAESFWDLMEVTQAPVIASHSGCRALCDHPRNLDDGQLKALAGNGGVIQVVAVGGFLKARSPLRPNRASVKDFVDHVDHAVQVAGIDHVGVGSDFDGGGGVPGFSHHGEALNVTVELVRRGYSEQQIAKIWGGNLLRVWREVEKVSAKLQGESQN
jgi:membrane dipeptidase